MLRSEPGPRVRPLLVKRFFRRITVGLVWAMGSGFRIHGFGLRVQNLGSEANVGS